MKNRRPPGRERRRKLEFRKGYLPFGAGNEVEETISSTRP